MQNRFISSCESNPTDRKKIIILGGGPNRIGQGIEFDYCCVHACYALKEAGFETIMINCNPETVSTDFDIADKLYFEPVYWEHLWEIVELEKTRRSYCTTRWANSFKTCGKITQQRNKNHWYIFRQYGHCGRSRPF